jgi:hypothetical protein
MIYTTFAWKEDEDEGEKTKNDCVKSVINKLTSL